MLTMEDVEHYDDDFFEEGELNKEFNLEQIDFKSLIPSHCLVPFVHGENNEVVTTITKLSGGICTILTKGPYCFYFFQ